MGNAATLHLEELIRQDFDEYLGGTRDFSNSRSDRQVKGYPDGRLCW